MDGSLDPPRSTCDIPPQMRTILSGGRIGLVVFWGMAALCVGAPASHAACSAPMRVMITRASDSIPIEVDGRRRILKPSGKKGLAVDGVRVGRRWSVTPSRGARVRGLPLSGRLTAVRQAADVVLVNEVPLEAYVAGAIGGEMPTGWSKAALRAQAVASRSFAVHQREAHRHQLWDVESGTRSQVYSGRNPPKAAREAVRDTGCEVLLKGGRPILAAFHSASGGRTASAAEVWGREVPYLVSVEVAGEEDSPDTYWRARISRSTLARSLAEAGHSIGHLREVQIEDRTPSGRVRWVVFRGSRGVKRLSGREVRSVLGESTLRSTLFELRSGDDAFLFVGSGSGHGVGMSQWGARGMAAQGSNYREILKTFYPGTRLGMWAEGRQAALGAQD